MGPMSIDEEKIPDRKNDINKLKKFIESYGMVS